MSVSKVLRVTLSVCVLILTVGIAGFANCSPLGCLIAFTRGEGRAQEIVVYDLETRTERYLTNNDVWDGLPTLSPSERRLAFVRAIPNRGVLEKPDFTLHEADEVIVVDPTNGRVICIGKSAHTNPYELGRCSEYWPDVPPLAGVMNLCWTQDETAILFEAPCSVTSDLILRMDVPSGELHVLCLGNDICSIGQDRFLIWRHEYDESGGYDPYYIIDSRGNEASFPPRADQ